MAVSDHDCDLWVTMVGWVDVPYSDWGDFRRQRAVDISSFRSVIYEHMLGMKFFSTSYEIALRWMSQNRFHDKSTLVQVMAWCHQATSHHVSQCWPRSMWPYGVTKPQCVEKAPINKAPWHYLGQCFYWLIINKVLRNNIPKHFILIAWKSCICT